jgi:hypothetical protein
MAESSYKDAKVIEASRNFVNIVAHQETTHGTKEVFVGREKQKLCDEYHTIPCETHTAAWGFVGRFVTGTFQTPTTFFADPTGKEISKVIGGLSAGELVKKMNEALAKVSGEKVPLAAWQTARQLTTDGEVAREKGELKKAVEAYTKLSKLRGGTIKADAEAALKKLDEEGEKQIEAALAEAGVDEKKKALKRISDDFKPLPCAAKAKKELDALK